MSGGLRDLRSLGATATANHTTDALPPAPAPLLCVPYLPPAPTTQIRGHIVRSRLKRARESCRSSLPTWMADLGDAPDTSWLDEITSDFLSPPPDLAAELGLDFDLSRPSNISAEDALRASRGGGQGPPAQPSRAVESGGGERRYEGAETGDGGALRASGGVSGAGEGAGAAGSDARAVAARKAAEAEARAREEVLRRLREEVGHRGGEVAGGTGREETARGAAGTGRRDRIARPGRSYERKPMRESQEGEGAGAGAESGGGAATAEGPRGAGRRHGGEPSAAGDDPVLGEGLRAPGGGASGGGGSPGGGAGAGGHQGKLERIMAEWGLSDLKTAEVFYKAMRKRQRASEAERNAAKYRDPGARLDRLRRAVQAAPPVNAPAPRHRALGPELPLHQGQMDLYALHSPERSGYSPRDAAHAWVGGERSERSSVGAGMASARRPLGSENRYAAPGEVRRARDREVRARLEDRLNSGAMAVGIEDLPGAGDGGDAWVLSGQGIR